MKKLILVLVFLLGIFVGGCNGIDLNDEELTKLSEKVIVCEKPYIRHATSCCLDQNNNKICDDDDEISKEKLVGGNVKEEPAEIRECMANTDDGYLPLNFECKTATDCDRHVDEISPEMEKLGITEGGLTYKEFVKSTQCIPSSYKKIPVDNGFIICESKADCINILYGDASEGTYIYKKAVICENNFCKILENSLKDTLSAARVGIFSSGTPDSEPESEEVIVVDGSGTIQEEDTE